ncbi:RHS repeat-associated core domain-containing protein, partial [Treponema bryantii]
NAPDNAQNVCVEYTYDANNHRIERISKTNSVAETTQYAYGRNGALTYQKKTSGSAVTTRCFVYLYNQIAGFMDKTEAGIETIRYAVTDIQGSVTEVYDDNYQLVWKSGYTAFGIKAGETTKLLDFEGLYTGCDYDVETGLTYHWNRWRSEDGDSWLTQDPARDGINWYGYAGQNPISHSDINGLEDTISAWQYQKDMEARKKERGETGNGGDNSSSGSCGPTGPTATPNIGSELINGLNYSINGLIKLDFGADFGRDGIECISEGKIIQGMLYICYGTIEAGIDLAGAYIGATALGATISAIGTSIAEQSLIAGYVDFEIKFNSQLSSFGGKVYNVFININNTITSNFGRYKTLSTTPADQVNSFLRETRGLKPPYKSGTDVSVLKLKKDSKFVRVYDNQNSFNKGPWIMREKDIKGLSPSEIQNKYS